jgi:hypothetical protein
MCLSLVHFTLQSAAYLCKLQIQSLAYKRSTPPSVSVDKTIHKVYLSMLCVKPAVKIQLIWVFTILAAFVQVLFISFMLNIMGSTTAASGATTAFMLWLGFVAPTSLANKLFAGHGFKVWAVDAGNHLVNFLLFGAILGTWR